MINRDIYVGSNEWNFLARYWPKDKPNTVSDPLWIISGTLKEFEDFGKDLVEVKLNLDKEKSNVKTENNASKDNFYSMKNVRKIDKEIKAKEKEQQTKIKNKKQEQIR